MRDRRFVAVHRGSPLDAARDRLLGVHAPLAAAVNECGDRPRGRDADATGSRRRAVRVTGCWLPVPGQRDRRLRLQLAVHRGICPEPAGEWRFRDPSLLTYEVARLADWLEAVATGAESQPWCGFIEPNLGFEVAGARAARVLRVAFAIEALPPWAKPGENMSVEFSVAWLDLVSAAGALRQQLRDFPQRADR